jgi:uncharacterized delta-60 repeat protein
MGHTGSSRVGVRTRLAVVLLGAAAAGYLPAGIGDVDETFGERGAAALLPYGPSYYRDAWQELPGGVLQLFGFERPDSRTLRVRLRRYDANGRPDAGWNGGREVITDLVAPADTPWEWYSSNEFATVAVGPSGQMFLVADAKRAEGQLFVVARLSRDGALDTGFGRQGFVSLARSFIEVRAIPYPQPDGSLLLGIGADPTGEGYGYSVPVEVRRIDVSGSLDGSFKSPDLLAYRAQEFVLVWAGADGRSWVVLDSGILRLAADGSPDRTLGNNGFLSAGAIYGPIVGVPAPSTYVAVQEAVLLPDARIVLAMAARAASLGVALVRLNADGSRDLSFGPVASGYAPIDVTRFDWSDATHVAAATRLRRAPDGSLALGLTVGSRSIATDFEAIALSAPDRTLLLRLSAGGLPDLRFGDGGAQLLSVDRRPLLVAAQARGAALIGHGDQLRRLSADSAAAPGLLSVQPYLKRAEGAGTVLLPVLRSVGSRGAVRVEFSTEDGAPTLAGRDAAVAGTDYEANSGRVDWADGESGLKFVPVRIIDDSSAEGYEFFRMRWRVVAGDVALVRGDAGGANVETTIEIEASDPSTTAFTPFPGASAATTPNGTASGGGGAIDFAALLTLIGAFVQRRRTLPAPAIDQGLA